MSVGQKSTGDTRRRVSAKYLKKKGLFEAMLQRVNL